MISDDDFYTLCAIGGEAAEHKKGKRKAPKSVAWSQQKVCVMSVVFTWYLNLEQFAIRALELNLREPV